MTINDYELAEHLKKSKFTPTQYSSFKNQNAQEWINYFFPREKRNNIKKLNIDRKKTNPDGKKLTGSLKLEGFSSLEELDFSFNEITNLELSQCPK
ncbi:MAG: hypothetical protein I3270_01670 [Candidatus Moeniiplasma glomeromycotorum]|nr:hypothetical protein [Candidatus Moeniiplasma glomeromycotorum]MCE8162415.1 hypothetical protein [Candidatus Moeniiplasma glomeromycotorum]MCE8166341.1 hypothetical protein [Candidatus Moeniiplasma glomeromycotorum]MCE8166823.1 hypothetical protein [Candidatus Moeniiplasma glomeromycotorum]